MRPPLHPSEILSGSTIETLYLARHAESADPTVFHGFESDIDLGPIGREQSNQFANRKDLGDVDLLVSSGQLRSLKTLEPLTRKLGLKPRIIGGFHERKVGVLQGTSTNSPESPFAKTRSEWAKGNKEFTTEGAENYLEVRERVFGALEELKNICNSTKARFPLVVSHGLTIKILLMEWLHGGDAINWDTIGLIKNTALWKLERPFRSASLQGCLSHLN